MQLTERIKKIPPYLFAMVDKKKAEARAKGIDIIDLGIGDPDMPTPKLIVDEMIKAVQNPQNHNYPPYDGTLAFRTAVAEWFQHRFGVSVDPSDEVLSLIGSKEGIAHSFLTYLDPGDIALLPDPGYPAYQVNALIAGAIPYSVPATEASNYEPELDKIPADILAKSKILFLNYPSNPTGAVASDAFYEKAIAFAKQHNILICMDLAYSEVYYENHKPKSILQFPGGKDVAIEFHTLSKTFNMTGWRIGMAVGNAEAVQALGKIKTNMDSGIFKAIQEAVIPALKNYESFVTEQNAIYQRRRDIIVDGLNTLGWNLPKPKATFYVWAPVPKGFTSEQFTIDLLDRTGILVVPGNGYGKYGEGYFRISITTSDDRLREAIERLTAHNVRYSA
ncbi:aminotransferase class I/II-fold pyridoxal phosphate-dependent enzyme [bacterium]|nr:aminotransferase class I/II-fold pyridoxal phosphate-dependent enzyme [bacterium]